MCINFLTDCKCYVIFTAKEILMYGFLLRGIIGSCDISSTAGKFYSEQSRGFPHAGVVLYV